MWGRLPTPAYPPRETGRRSTTTATHEQHTCARAAQNSKKMHARCCYLWPFCGRMPGAHCSKSSSPPPALKPAPAAPSFALPPSAAGGNADVGGTCTICVGALRLPHTLSCGHTFCTACLTRWLHQAASGASCPLCRAPLPASALSPAALAKAAMATGAPPEEARAAVAEAVEAAAAAEVAAARAQLLWRYGEPPSHWLWEPQHAEEREAHAVIEAGGRVAAEKQAAAAAAVLTARED